MKKIFILSIVASALFFSCNTGTQKETNSDTSTTLIVTDSVRTENVEYSAGDTKMIGFAAYPKEEGNHPVVFIIPEWWGLNDYAKSRAKQLAELGYVGFALDVYGNGKTADNPTDAEALAKPFYGGMNLIQPRFEAALNKANDLPGVDTSKKALIGYCFGGAMTLNLMRAGEPLKGGASFHGNLVTGYPANKDNIQGSILVLHGEADNFVPAEEVTAFKKEMDSVKADYKFVGYPGAVHAFTNPNATATGEKFGMNIKYDEAADKASWEELKQFLNKIF